MVLSVLQNGANMFPQEAACIYLAAKLSYSMIAKSHYAFCVLLCRRSLLPLGVLVVIGILVLTIWGTDASNNQEKAVLLPIRDNGGFAGGLISLVEMCRMPELQFPLVV